MNDKPTLIPMWACSSCGYNSSCQTCVETHIKLCQKEHGYNKCHEQGYEACQFRHYIKCGDLDLFFEICSFDRGGQRKECFYK
jgi:hypothetical protein